MSRKEYTVLQVIAAFIKHDVYPGNYPTTIDTTEVSALIDNIISMPDLPVEQAQHMIDTIINGISMDILRGRTLSPFISRVYDEIVDPTMIVPVRSYNFVSYVLKVYKQYSNDNELAEFAFNSKFVGTTKDKITLNLRILNCRRIDSATANYYRPDYFYIAIAVDENNNLFKFSPKGPLKSTNDFNYYIKATIKKHEIDRYSHNAQVTSIFYVKELNEQ